MRESSEELMTRVRTGDLEAFEDLVERFKVGVFSFAYQIVRSREDAEEAAQDTFLKLFRAREDYETGRAVSPWVLKIAANTCKDLLRRRKGRQKVSSDNLNELGFEVADPHYELPARHRIEADEVRSLMNGLSDGYRIPLVLKYLNGMTNREISDALGISLSNVKVRLARARELLMHRLRRLQEKS